MEDRIKALEAKLEQTKAKLFIAISALTDIANWDDDLDDEWGDPGEYASEVLEKITSDNLD